MDKALGERLDVLEQRLIPKPMVYVVFNMHPLPPEEKQNLQPGERVVSDHYRTQCGYGDRIDTTNKEVILYSFTGGADGGFPNAGVVVDSKGNDEDKQRAIESNPLHWRHLVLKPLR